MAKKKAEKELVAEVVAEPKVEEKVEDNTAERFIMRKLSVINKLPDSAKAQRLAARVLMNNRKG